MRLLNSRSGLKAPLRIAETATRGGRRDGGIQQCTNAQRNTVT